VSELPQLDPNWTRRQKHSQDRSPLVAGLVVTAIALAGLWVVRAELEMQGARRQAESNSQAIGAVAVQRLRAWRRSEQARTRQRFDSQHNEGIRTPFFAGSNIGGKEIHRCRYAGTAVYQTGPCKAPWMEAPALPGSTRQQRVNDQARMQARAEAKLQMEQNRLSAVTARPGQPWQPTIAMGSARARCENAKASRDAAYLAAGNNRTFDFIRRWNDFVFDACKQV
jgi:hypothetical protein